MDVELLEQIYNCKWLTPREKRIWELKYSEGLLNYQIAMEMNCCRETISREIARIEKKIKPLITEYSKSH